MRKNRKQSNKFITQGKRKTSSKTTPSKITSPSNQKVDLVLTRKRIGLMKNTMQPSWKKTKCTLTKKKNKKNMSGIRLAMQMKWANPRRRELQKKRNCLTVTTTNKAAIQMVDQRKEAQRPNNNQYNTLELRL